MSVPPALHPPRRALGRSTSPGSVVGPSGYAPGSAAACKAGKFQARVAAFFGAELGAGGADLFPRPVFLTSLSLSAFQKAVLPSAYLLQAPPLVPSPTNDVSLGLEPGRGGLGCALSGISPAAARIEPGPTAPRDCRFAAFIAFAEGRDTLYLWSNRDT